MSSEIDDAMLKTLFDSAKSNYGFGSIAGMVKPSLYFCSHLRWRIWVVTREPDKEQAIPTIG